MMSKKTLIVLAFASILLGCGENTPSSVTPSAREVEQEKAVYNSTLNERRLDREKMQARLFKLKQELAAERAKNAQSERVKILEATLSQMEKEAAEQRAETYRLVRERKLKEQQQKAGGK